MRFPLLALCAFFSTGALWAQVPEIVTTPQMQEPLGELSDPKLFLYVLDIAAGRTIPTHSHAGSIFAYVLQGQVENQLDPEPPKTFQPGGYFHEFPKQVHRLMRNLSSTEPAKVLILQSGGTLSASIKALVQEPLANATNQEISVRLLTVPPGAALTGAYQHPGPVVAFVLKGEIENQVEPGQPRTYRVGEAFYDPPMHVHRVFRNQSKTETAEVLLFQAGEIGQPLAVAVEK